MTNSRTDAGRVIAGLVLFSVSFGYVEAAVVAYLRVLYEPIHQRLHPGRSTDDLFPLITLAQLQSEEPRALHWLTIELFREYGTLLMLVAVAAVLARNLRQWLAAFMFAFGLWDLAFYGFLKVLIDWPASLADWDLLFLLPAPWVGPVWAPLVVALTLIGAGLLILHREAGGLPPLYFGRVQVVALFFGALMIVSSFCWDWRNISGGGTPNEFHWELFALGEGVGVFGLLHGWLRSKDEKPTDAGPWAQDLSE